jgi:hypothetical protein
MMAVILRSCDNFPFSLKTAYARWGDMYVES